jgi:UDP-N-acetylmuramate dehydrogenase
MNILKILEADLGKGRIKLQEPLARFTTLRIGGPAEYFFVATTTKEISKAFKVASKVHIPVFLLGGGTNVVISDKGLNGLIVRNEARMIKIIKRMGKVIDTHMQLREAIVEVDAGTMMNQLVRFSCDEGLAGLERHLGLPGTVGGALYMNSKWTKPPTYVGDVLLQATVMDAKGETKQVDHKYFDFAYDHSILQKTHEIVLTAQFLLKAENPKILWDRGQASMEYRKKTQPMGAATAGCTFRNIAVSDAVRIATPNHTTSAGYLVDQVGLKNFQYGKAKFSDIHANFIINLGGATAADVKGLIDEAKKRVQDSFGVTIQPEIVLLGEFDA